MNRSLLVTALFLTACLEPVDVGTHDAGHDGGVTLPRGCVVGMDQTCNELATMSALAGTCSVTGCVCATGFQRGLTGKCRPPNLCPSTPQNPGDACSTEGLVCRYSRLPVDFGCSTVRCGGSTWLDVPWVETLPWDFEGSCPGCPGSPLQCVVGTVGGVCSDGFVFATCQSNGWVCPQGTISSTLCACSGNRPGCTCTSQGWSCADGGTMNCTPGIAMSCNDGPVDGGIGGVAGTCSNTGTCTCLSGFELNPTNGRCRASSSLNTCTVGMDQQCNANAAMSGLAGTCVAGRCECNPGFALTTAGTCSPSSSGYCVVNNGTGQCSIVSPDGGVASSGLCGSQVITAGCSCEGSPPMPRCLGLCPPTAGRTCVSTNCGSINCLPPLRCTGTNICTQ
jgi:hypothetical protein